MATFLEWRIANLTAEQEAELNFAGEREGNRAIAMGATDITEGWKFPTPEQLDAFLTSDRDPVFVKYWDMYIASQN
jgi:hypothetical protein